MKNLKDLAPRLIAMLLALLSAAVAEEQAAGTVFDRDGGNPDEARTNYGTVCAYSKYGDMVLEFTPDAALCACTKIGWIQIVRRTKGTDAKGNPIVVDRNGKPIESPPNGGWAIDRKSNSRSPIYGAEGPKENESGWGQIPEAKGHFFGGAKTTASLIDAPFADTAGYTWDFEAALFCLEGELAGKCLGVYRWRAYQKEGGFDGVVHSKTAAVTGTPSGAFQNAVKMWNGVPGNIDAPDPSKW